MRASLRRYPADGVSGWNSGPDIAVAGDRYSQWRVLNWQSIFSQFAIDQESADTSGAYFREPDAAIVAGNNSVRLTSWNW